MAHLLAKTWSFTVPFMNLIIGHFAFPSVNSEPFDSWCFVKDSCNQENPSSAWNQGSCANGKAQSPIDINITYEHVAGPPKVDFSDTKNNYDLTSFILKNDGRHVELSGFKTATGKRPTFSWSEREESIYTLQEIHMHWGPSDNNGSEHSIAGVKYAMEMHLIHYKSSSASDGFRDIAEAKSSGRPDALATIAVLFQAVSSGPASESLRPLIRNLGNVTHRGDKVSVEEGVLKLSDIIKVQLKAIAYLGSMTSPTCDEVVVWLVIPDPVNMKAEDIQIFRDSVHGVDGKILQTNRRRLQSANDRLLEVVTIQQ